jgi:hypothetical protein
MMPLQFHIKKLKLFPLFIWNYYRISLKVHASIKKVILWQNCYIDLCLNVVLKNIGSKVTTKNEEKKVTIKKLTNIKWINGISLPLITDTTINAFSMEAYHCMKFGVYRY